MHKDPFVFSQLAQFLNRSKFNRIVAKYDGDKYVKSYTCWNQLLTMMFGQLSNREAFGISSSHWKRMQARSITSESENP